MTVSILNILPVDLITQILDTLDFASILKCEQVCRLFKIIIEGNASLQYTIELAVSGQQDGLTSLSHFARREKLKRHELTWDRLSWTSEKQVPMLNGGLWELYGGVLAQSTPRGDLSFLRLPSSLRSIEEKQWTLERSNLGTSIRDFGMDPSQDLLVLIEDPRWSGPNADHLYRFHLRSLATGDRHPLAPNPAVQTHPQIERDPGLSYTIQISGDYIGILFNSLHAGENELYIWRWKTGEIQVDVLGDQIRSFAFLSESHIAICLMGANAEELSISVLNFIEESNASCFYDELEHAFMLRYPALHEDVDLISFEIRSDPAPGLKPGSDLQVPFSLSPKNRIYAATLWAQIDGAFNCIVHFIPAATFTSRLLSQRNGTEIKWGEWGPNETRMMMDNMHQPSNVWVCYVYGSRYVTPLSDPTGDEGHADAGTKAPSYTGSMYDFNQLALRRHLGNSGAPCNNDMKFVVSETVFEAGALWAEEVRTSLPYRTCSFKLDPPYNRRRCAVMCSEDSLIIVDLHIDNRYYRILTF